MADLVEFNKRVVSSFRRKDGALLKELLKIHSLSATRAMEEYVTNGGELPKIDEEP